MRKRLLGLRGDIWDPDDANAGHMMLYYDRNGMVKSVRVNEKDSVMKHERLHPKGQSDFNSRLEGIPKYVPNHHGRLIPFNFKCWECSFRKFFVEMTGKGFAHSKRSLSIVRQM